MRVMEELVELQWATPLEALVDLPGAVLYGLVLTFAHATGPQALAAIRSALGPLLGDAKEHKGLFASRLEWSGRIPAELAVKKSKATLRVGQRLKPARVAEVIRAVATIPGATDLQLQARIRRFEAPGADGPMLDG